MHRKRTPDDYEEAFIWSIGLTNKETGCQFGVPGGTYPPIKYPSAPPRAASTQWTAEHGNWHVTGKTVWQYSKLLIVNISQAIILWFALTRASARNYQLLNSPRWSIFSINLWREGPGVCKSRRHNKDLRKSYSITEPRKTYMNYTFPCYETKVAWLFQSKLSLILEKDKSKQFHSLIKLWSTFNNAKNTEIFCR